MGKHTAGVVFAGLLPLLGAAPTWSGQPPNQAGETAEETPAPAPSDGDLREEITVTAQKRAERLSDVPIAITALDGDTIEASRIEKVEEVEALTANLHFQTIGVSRPQVHLRGVGTGAFDAGSDPSVAVFIDEVYLSRFGAMQFDLFDLERIEILKGPQGALFGRNTAGGAINIVTRPPSATFVGRVELSGGNLSAGTGHGMVNGALADGVFARLSAAGRKRAGYSKNLTTGDDENDENSLGGRLGFEFQPGDRTAIRLSGDWGRDRLAMWANESITDSIFLLFPPLASKFAATPDRFSEPYTRSGYQDRDQLGFALRLDYQAGGGTLTSLTSYRDNEFDEYQDLDATLADSIDRRAIEDAQTFTQEVRFASSTVGRVDWLVGAYYLHEQVERRDDAVLGVDSVLAWVFNGGRAYTPIWRDSFETDAYAGFAHVSIALAERLNLSLGARYSEDDKSLDRVADNHGVASPILVSSYQVKSEDSWSSFDPQISLDYHLNDRSMVYISYREGFKSGGFQYLSPTAAASSVTFDPEQVTLYEAGVKARSRRGRVAVDASLFTNDYRDLQFLAATGEATGGGFIVVITNAAQATAKGAELDLKLRPVSGLEIGLGAGLLDATFDAYIDGNGKDNSGHKLLRSPETSGHVVAQYGFPLGAAAGALTVRAMWSYKDKIYFDPDNTERLAQPAYDLLDASVSYDSANGRWRMSAWAKNLTNEEYYKNVIPLSSSLVGIATMGVPRTYGVTVGRGW